MNAKLTAYQSKFVRVYWDKVRRHWSVRHMGGDWRGVELFHARELALCDVHVVTRLAGEVFPTRLTWYSGRLLAAYDLLLHPWPLEIADEPDRPGMKVGPCHIVTPDQALYFDKTGQVFIADFVQERTA